MTDRIRKLKYTAAFFLCLLAFKTNSQINPDISVQQKLEELTETSSIEPDFSDLADKVADLAGHPINLNAATEEELRQMPFLSPKQVANLLTYRETYGEILSVYELQSVDGFDSATISNILPFVAVTNIDSHHKIVFRELFSRGRLNAIFRYQQILQRQEGYFVPDSVAESDPGAAYAGSQQKYWFRVNYNYYDRISIGITGEKDPGEEFFKGSQPYGMDFYSGYFALKYTGFLKNLVIGNFSLDFGQGLTLCSALSFGALPSSGNLRRVAGGVRPSLSGNESRYFRGIASVIGFKNISLSLFYSRHRRDANVVMTDPLNGTVNEISSFQETGYHRLPEELSEKNAIREQVYGGNLNYRHSYFTAGITAFHSEWNAFYQPAQKPYSRYQFTGNSNLNIGADFQFIFRTIYGFGEIARSLNGGMAWLAGLQVNPDPNARFSLILRDYQPEYQDLVCNAIGQNSYNSNEKGLIFNVSARLAPKLGFYAYIDVYKFPWLKYRTDFLSDGNEISLQVDYSPASSLTMLLRYRRKSGEINSSVDAVIHPWIRTTSQSLRFQSDWRVNPRLSLADRFEVVKSSAETESASYGYYISQDVSFTPGKAPISATLRYALFNTDSYDNRIYTYEKDVLYGYSVPALDGTGLRVFVLVSWKPWRFLEIWLRYSETFYYDRNVIGTGLESINGNQKTEIKLQAMIRL